MRYKIYFSFLGNEKDVRRLSQAVGESSGVLEHLKRVSESVSPTGCGAPWSWRSERVAISAENPGEGIQDYLTQHREIGEAIARHRRENTYASLTVIAHYEEGDAPRGIALSSAAIALMNEYKLAFEVDAVELME